MEAKSLKENAKASPNGHTKERRRWNRLPLAIPIFVRSKDGKGKEALEFATALNISAGGILVAVRRLFPRAARFLLEIPSAPLVGKAELPKRSRLLKARLRRIVHADGYHLLGLEFSRALTPSLTPATASRRKAPALV